MIQTSDYTGGIITVFNQDPFLQITATVESFTKTRIKMRITMSDREGIIEDEEKFGKLFDDIQTEVFTFKFKITLYVGLVFILCLSPFKILQESKGGFL